MQLRAFRPSFSASENELYIFRQWTYTCIVFILQSQKKNKRKYQIVFTKCRNKRRSNSSKKFALKLLPCFNIAQYEAGTRKKLYIGQWPYITKYINSIQFNCSKRTKGGWKMSKCSSEILVIMYINYLETLKTDVIIVNSNVIMCLTSHMLL